MGASAGTTVMGQPTKAVCFFVDRVPGMEVGATKRHKHNVRLKLNARTVQFECKGAF
jgi:hypothetical protein